jgi:transportin-1
LFVQAAYSALAQICEDIPEELEKMSIQGQRPLDFIIPKLVNAIQSPQVKVRLQALNAIKPFIVPPPSDSNPEPQSLAPHIHTFVSQIFKIASDPNTGVRKRVCETMVQLLSNRPDVLLNEIGNVIDYMLHCTQDEDTDLAVEACEFWLTFAELQDENLAAVLRAHLGRIAPVLLNSMVYGEIEISQLGGDEDDDAAQPDRDQDIKPRTYGGKSHGNERVADAELGDASQSGNASRARSVAGGAGLDEDEDYEDDDDDDDEDTTEWTLRKCAAAALDVMAIEFEIDLLNILLPHLKDKLWSQEWTQRESGILALGAIAEGRELFYCLVRPSPR